MHKEPTRKGQLLSVTDGTLTESDARMMLERIRWPDGLVCAFPDCGGAEVYRIEVKGSVRKNGKAVGPRHLYKCKACRRQFSVTKGTIFEDSKIPLRTWILVMYRMCSSKKGLSAYQIHREFGMSYKNAWFMAHRIRFAMFEKDPTILEGTVEADETYIGGKPRGHRIHRAAATIRARYLGEKSPRIEALERKTPVFGILERGGRVRAMAMPDLSQQSVERALLANLKRGKTQLMTDEHKYYHWISGAFPHGVIRHHSEYVRGDIHTQGIEGFWSQLKRGITSTYHHVDQGYLNQYVQEFAFRHNTRRITDTERFNALLANVSGRLDWYLASSEAEPS